MAVYDGDLYVGGQFGVVDSTINAFRIAHGMGPAGIPLAQACRDPLV